MYVLPVQEMCARSEELARRWAITLIAARPLREAGELPLASLAREAPALCEEVLRALASDEQLLREPGGTGRALVAILGDGEPAVLVDAVEALRRVLWEELSERLPAGGLEPGAGRLRGDACDRLAAACAALLAGALADSRESSLTPARTPGRGEDHGLTPIPPPGAPAQIVDEAPASTAAERPSRVDRRVASPAAAPTGAPRAGRREELEERPLSWDESPPVPPALSSDEIAIRDERAEEGPGAWMRSIGLELHRFQEGGEPFAVLLAEALDELAHGQEAEGLSARLTHQVEERLATELRRWGGTLTRQRAGRYWLVVPDTDAAAAVKLAEGLGRAVDASMAHRGLTLKLAVGTAVCPEDGRDAATLAAHADVALCSARRSTRAQARALSSLEEPARRSGG